MKTTSAFLLALVALLATAIFPFAASEEGQHRSLALLPQYHIQHNADSPVVRALQAHRSSDFFTDEEAAVVLTLFLEDDFSMPNLERRVLSSEETERFSRETFLKIYDHLKPEEQEQLRKIFGNLPPDLQRGITQIFDALSKGGIKGLWAFLKSGFVEAIKIFFRDLWTQGANQAFKNALTYATFGILDLPSRSEALKQDILTLFAMLPKNHGRWLFDLILQRVMNAGRMAPGEEAEIALSWSDDDDSSISETQTGSVSPLLPAEEVPTAPSNEATSDEDLSTIPEKEDETLAAETPEQSAALEATSEKIPTPDTEDAKASPHLSWEETSAPAVIPSSPSNGSLRRM